MRNLLILLKGLWLFGLKLNNNGLASVLMMVRCMLQAFLTTMMLSIDEGKTRQQMQAAGIEYPPFLNDFIEQLDLMVVEVALAADELMSGNKSVSVGSKDVSRNDSCPCSGSKKFKQCCGA